MSRLRAVPRTSGENVQVARRLTSCGAVAEAGIDPAVASPDTNDIVSVGRLRRCIEPELAERGCSAISPTELDRLEGHLTATQIEFECTPLPIQECLDCCHEVLFRLLAATPTSWTDRTLRILWQATDRYIHSVGERQASVVAGTYLYQIRQIIEVYRTRDGARVRRVVNDSIETHIDVVLACLSNGS